MKKILGTIAIMTPIVLALTACSSPEPAQVSVEVPLKEESPVNVTVPNNVISFDETYTWSDGLEVRVGSPDAFEPTPTAYGAGEPGTNFVFPVTYINGSTEPIKISALDTITAGGTVAEKVYDTGSDLGEVGNPPSVTILPGKSVSWYEAATFPGTDDIQFETQPTVQYRSVIFTTNP